MPKLLIADDEPSIRRTLREILEYEDFVVDEATDGNEALSMIRKATTTSSCWTSRCPAATAWTCSKRSATKSRRSS